MDRTAPLTLDVRYFAALREQIGRAADRLDAAPGVTPHEVWERLHGAPPPPGVLVAIDQHIARWDTPIERDAELAFFPPVTGG